MAQSRKFIVAGNWKMNGTHAENVKLVAMLNNADIDYSQVDVVVAPPALYVDSVRRSLRPEIGVGTQNVLHKSSGAFTGEISPSMLADVGAKWAIVGHSERREMFGDTNELVAQKAAFAVKAGISVLACVGEKLTEREAGTTFDVVRGQLAALASTLSADEFASGAVVIAYEPVWAIGTGKVATPQQAQEVHAEIRAWAAKHFGSATGAQVRIVYGGSVNGGNSRDLAAQPDIDGFLVGGASLKPEFVDICNAAAACK